jgi:hypothetical protein
MRPLSAWRLLAVLLACMSTAAVAEPFGWATGFSELYRVNLATGQATRIGGAAAIGFNDVEGLAISPGGLLYGVADGTRNLGGGSSASTDFLIRISTATGIGALVGQLPGLQGQGPGGQLDYGLAFTCDGRLWMASGTTGSLWEVDPTTAAVRLVGNAGQPIAGLAARGNTLYGISVDPQPGLYRVNRDTAAATLIGPLGVGGAVASAGLDFTSDGRLWATLDPNDSTRSRIVQVNPSTGAGTVVGTVNVDLDFRGLAIDAPSCSGAAPEAIPGPGLPLLLLLAGLAGGIGARRLSQR